MRRSRAQQPSAGDPQLKESLNFLRRAGHYPGRPRRLRLIETHFAWVFLTARRAYKLKKPTVQGGMDYRTLAQREQGCRNELRLNRRLARAVYLAVVPLKRTPRGTLSFQGRGAVVEWLVKMQRLPAAGMLDRAAVAGRVSRTQCDAVVRLLVRFFRRAHRVPMSPRRYRQHLRARTRATARELCAPDLGLERSQVQRVARGQLALIRLKARELGARGARLIEGHGDLRPEHIYVGSARSAPCVIDCLEFDPGLRRLDPAEELAFLALECARLGARALATRLLARYRQLLPDRGASSVLIHFYMSQRAFIRAMIAAWHVRDPQFATQRPAWRARARSYLKDALVSARRGEREERRRASVLKSYRPVRQQRRERPAGDHAAHGLTQQWRDRQYHELRG